VTIKASQTTGMLTQEHMRTEEASCCPCSSDLSKQSPFGPFQIAYAVRQKQTNAIISAMTVEKIDYSQHCHYFLLYCQVTKLFECASCLCFTAR